MNNQFYEVIMADDDEDDRLLVGSLLKQHCPTCTLRYAENGQELLDQLHQSDLASPSLILLDLNMPVLGGFKTLRLIRENPKLRAVPVIVLTTSEEAVDIDRSYALGANAFLTKPNTHDDLRTMVLHLRDFWLKSARLPTRLDASADTHSY